MVFYLNHEEFILLSKMAAFSLAWICVLWLGVAEAQSVTAAVASNFLKPFRQIAAKFEIETGHSVRIVSGSTGKLYAQIVHGAPFDVFLAADNQRPALLEQKKHAVPGTRFTYARGRLALWSVDPQRIQTNGKQALTQGSLKHLALANPKTAPYGRAAREVLQNLKLWDRYATRIVRGENVSQTLQFVATGNVELGFVALSQVLSLSPGMRGSHWEIPENLHAPIRQDAILCTHGKNSPAALALIQFLKEPSSQNIIRHFGYTLEEN